jgi:hypothetical protein
MAVAGEIASGRVVLDGDGCLPLEALVAARARRTASARRVIAILQGWNWVRRVGRAAGPSATVGRTRTGRRGPTSRRTASARPAPGT